MSTAFDQRVERIGVTGAQGRVIAVVARNPGTTQRNIASMLGVTEVTAGRLVDRLCESGHLKRRADPNDRRAYKVHLASTAQPILKQLRQIATLTESQIFAGLSENELKLLETCLDKFARNVLKARACAAARATRPTLK